MAPLLNTIFGWNLELVGSVNYRGIDLDDPAQKIGIQVSSDQSSGKISKALEVVAASSLNQSIKSLYFFFLQLKQKTYTVKLCWVGVVFDIGQRIMDFDSLIQKLNTCNLDVLGNSASVVKSFYPIYFKKRCHSQTISETTSGKSDFLRSGSLLSA